MIHNWLKLFITTIGKIGGSARFYFGSIALFAMYIQIIKQHLLLNFRRSSCLPTRPGALINNKLEVLEEVANAVFNQFTESDFS